MLTFEDKLLMKTSGMLKIFCHKIVQKISDKLEMNKKRKVEQLFAKAINNRFDRINYRNMSAVCVVFSFARDCGDIAEVKLYICMFFVEYSLMFPKMQN